MPAIAAKAFGHVILAEEESRNQDEWQRSFIRRERGLVVLSKVSQSLEPLLPPSCERKVEVVSILSLLVSSVNQQASPPK